MQCNILCASLAAADTGIDNPLTRRVYVVGMPPSKTTMQQALGRLGRGSASREDDYVFNMLLSVSDYAYLRARSYKNDGTLFSLEQLHEELIFCTVMTDCWHYALEKEFGQPDSDDCLPNSCDGFCPRCSNSIQDDLAINILPDKLKDYLMQVFRTHQARQGIHRLSCTR
jgi:superfamily II DNA or RNA helicase